jgi:hypothetical protein
VDYKDKTEKEQEIELKGDISSIETGTKLNNWKIENLREPCAPVKISLGFEAEKYAAIDGKRMQINLFPYLFFADFSRYFTSSERMYPFDVKLPSSYLYQFEFRIPEGYKIFYIPENFEYSDSLMKLKSSAVLENNTVNVSRKVYLNRRRYSPKDYSLMREKWGDFAKPEMGFLILERK